MKHVFKWVGIIMTVLLVIGGIALFIISRIMQNMMGGKVELSYTHELHQVEDGGSAVYMTTEISPDAEYL